MLQAPRGTLTAWQSLEFTAAIICSVTLKWDINIWLAGRPYDHMHHAHAYTPQTHVWVHGCRYLCFGNGGLDDVGGSGASWHTAAAAAADGETAELAVTYMSLLWTSSGETDVRVGFYRERRLNLSWIHFLRPLTMTFCHKLNQTAFLCLLNWLKEGGTAHNLVFAQCTQSKKSDLSLSVSHGKPDFLRIVLVLWSDNWNIVMVLLWQSGLFSVFLTWKLAFVPSSKSLWNFWISLSLKISSAASTGLW